MAADRASQAWPTPLSAPRRPFPRLQLPAAHFEPHVLLSQGATSWTPILSVISDNLLMSERGPAASRASKRHRRSACPRFCPDTLVGVLSLRGLAGRGVAASGGLWKPGGPASPCSSRALREPARSAWVCSPTGHLPLGNQRSLAGICCLICTGLGSDHVSIVIAALQFILRIG